MHGSNLALAQNPAAVPAVASSDLNRQYDAAFQAMLAQPANLDVLFKFASLASQTGDLEGAVSALERMLLINPDLPRVRLELGVLYYRLGSYEVARTYLESALKTPNLPPEVRNRADQFMAEVVGKQQPSSSRRTSRETCFSVGATNPTPISAPRPAIFCCSGRSPASISRRSARPTGVSYLRRKFVTPTTSAARTTRRSKPSSAPM